MYQAGAYTPVIYVLIVRVGFLTQPTYRYQTGSAAGECVVSTNDGLQVATTIGPSVIALSTTVSYSYFRSNGTESVSSRKLSLCGFDFILGLSSDINIIATNRAYVFAVLDTTGNIQVVGIITCRQVVNMTN